jgi:hypothetical protein
VPVSPRAPEAPALDLPDLDKSEDTEDVDVGSFELDLGSELDVDEGDDALDTFQVDIEQLADGGENEPASDLDIGVNNLLDTPPDAPAGRDGDSMPPVSGELDWQLDAPLEADEPSTDAELGDDGLEALPELPVEDPEGEAGPDLERGLLPGAPEGTIPQGPRFEPEWLLLGAACSALGADAAGVVACAEQLMRFGPERRSVPLPGGVLVSSLALLGSGSTLLSTARGLLELTSSGSWSYPEVPDALRGSGASVTELAATPGPHDLWARSSNGVLLRRRGNVWERHQTGGSVRSLTGGAEHLALLVIAERPTLQLSSDAGSSFQELLLPEPALNVALGGSPLAVARAGVLALADPERGLCVSGNAGATFHMVTGGVNVTAVTIGEHGGKLVVFAALHREGRDVTELLLVDPDNGAACSIAELSGEADEESEETGRTLALIFANGYLWAAGGYGLARLRPSPP